MNNELVIQQIKQVTVISFQNISVMDSANIESLGHSLLELVEQQDHRQLVLDFTPVRFMSSQALGILLQLKKALDEVKGRMIIVGMQPDLQKVFKITNLQKLFVFKNETDIALADFGFIFRRCTADPSRDRKGATTSRGFTTKSPRSPRCGETYDLCKTSLQG